MAKKHQEKPATIKLSECRDIALMLLAVAKHKTMGYRNAATISRLANDIKGRIDFEIGEDLREVQEKVKSRVEAIKGPIVEEYKNLSEEERVEREAEFNKRYSKAINQDPELQELGERELELWNQDSENDIDSIEIEEKEFTFDEIKPIHLYGIDYRIDGFDALVELSTMDIIKLKS